MGIGDKFKAIFIKKKPLAETDEKSDLKPGTDARQRDAPTSKGYGLDNAEKEECISRLTPREYDVLLLLLEGFTLMETACKLGIAYSTANTHQTAIYRKLKVNSKAELIINFRGLNAIRRE